MAFRVNRLTIASVFVIFDFGYFIAHREENCQFSNSFAQQALRKSAFRYHNFILLVYFLSHSSCRTNKFHHFHNNRNVFELYLFYWHWRLRWPWHCISSLLMFRYFLSKIIRKCFQYFEFRSQGSFRLIRKINRFQWINFMVANIFVFIKNVRMCVWRPSTLGNLLFSSPILLFFRPFISDNRFYH